VARLADEIRARNLGAEDPGDAVTAARLPLGLLPSNCLGACISPINRGSHFGELDSVIRTK